MSASINTGGPAFPSMRDMRHSPDFDHEEGMALRDYFAAKAMQPLIAGRNWNAFIGSDEELIAQWARSSYAVADAMLKAREA